MFVLWELGIGFLGGEDGREEGFEQVLPAGLRSGEDPAAAAAEEPTDQGADDASDEHQVQHVRDIHLQGDQVQFSQRGPHRRGTVYFFLRFLP